MGDTSGPERRAQFRIGRRPALPAAVLFMAGIAAHRALPPAPLVYLFAIAVTLAVGWRLFRRPVWCSTLLALATALSGLTAAQLFAFYYPADHVCAFATEDPRLAQVELYIDNPPRVLTNPFDRRRALPPKQVTTARVTRVRTWSGWVDATGDVLVQIAQPHPRLATGQTVRAIGQLQRPAPAMNPGQFDWAHYYRDQRVLASFSVSHADNIRIIEERFPGPLAWARERCRRLLAAGFPAERSLDHALLRALLLGDHDPQLRDVQEQFQRTGTSHHLSISGMHVAVLGGCVYFLCRLLCLSPRRSVWIGMSFVLAYGLMALPSPPVVRSVLLCLAFGLGIVFRRSVDAVQLLSLSVLGMLAWHPLDLYSAGFQLSFGTVLGLMLLARPMMEFLRSFRDRDMEIARSLQKPTQLDSVRAWIDNSVVGAMATGLVAWWVSMPLIAYHFEQLNPWAIPAGILLAPFVFASLVGGLLKVVLTALWPGLSGTWAALAATPVAWMRWAVDGLARWPGADVPVPPPALWLIAAFYLLLLTAMLPRLRPGLRWCLRAGRVAPCLVMLVLPLQRGLAQLAPEGETRVTLLAVGAGQCAVVQPPSGRTVLVDAGSSSLSDLVGKCLGPFLRHARCTEVDTIVMSHGDYDHISAVEELVRGYGVREVWTSPQLVRHAAPGSQVQELLAALDRMERTPRLLAPGDRTPLGRDTSVEVLWPPPDAKLSQATNDACLVIKLTHAGRSILFPGDIQDLAMRELLRDPAKLKSDVLVAPHHGSSESLTPAFVRAVDPQYVVSSNDRTLTNKQREFERMIGSRPLYRTNRCGAITIVITREGELRVEPFLPQHRSP
jgi:competence protein ComEC